MPRSNVGQRSHTLKRVIGVMDGKALRSDEIAELAATSVSNVRLLLKALKETGLVHIAGWERRKWSGYTAKYKLGSGTDVPKPAPYTPTESNQRYRAALRERVGEWYTELRKAQQTKGKKVTVVRDGQVVYPK